MPYIYASSFTVLPHLKENNVYIFLGIFHKGKQMQKVSQTTMWCNNKYNRII
jgi:hypothetical protein